MQRTFDDIIETAEEARKETVSVSVEAFLLKKDDLERGRDRVYDAIINSGDGVTVKELADRWGCASNEISGRFTELAVQGVIVPAGKRYSENKSGRLFPHTVWVVRL